MSMSQEEIEALMNGLDIDDGEPEEVSEPVKVNTKEIEELLSQTEDFKESLHSNESEMDFDFDTLGNIEDSRIVDNSEIENLLNEIESVTPVKEVIVEDKKLENIIQKSEDEIVRNWTASKIDEGIFPLPAEKDTKVVNQLSQVANDSEEKVSQIFDVLSLTLDNNSAIRNKLKKNEEFISSQVNLLNSLSSKFPNIKVFNEHLGNAKDISNSINEIKNILNDEDNHIFQAMELMQFNDINRQKIERVMAVIRKLSLYLNNLFEDDGSSKDIAVAKHIHGDENSDLIGDDLDKLIAEFNNK